MRTIALEEHFATEGFMGGPGRELRALAASAKAHPKVAAGYARLVEGLCDLGEGRVAAMDDAGVNVQVLSLTSPGVEQLDAPEAVAIAREANDVLAEAARRRPDRLAGFAALPTPAPEDAAEELERTVLGNGFVGAMINGHSRGRYLDDPFFRPVLERAETLGVPIYLHPTPPPRAVVEASYAGNFAPGVKEGLSAAAWGWHVETATHVLRLILGGTFDRFPGLQIVVGHMGEGLPFFLPRLELALPEVLTKLERPVGDYLRGNVHYTFGGFNWTQAFLDLLLQVGAERVMFSADHPYAPMGEARAFLDGLPVCPADRERIAHGNAERLLGL
jgi:uncharacterized protein